MPFRGAGAEWLVGRPLSEIAASAAPERKMSGCSTSSSGRAEGVLACNLPNARIQARERGELDDVMMVVLEIWKCLQMVTWPNSPAVPAVPSRMWHDA